MELATCAVCLNDFDITDMTWVDNPMGYLCIKDAKNVHKRKK